MTKCQLNLPSPQHVTAISQAGENGAVPVVDTKMGGQATSAD